MQEMNTMDSKGSGKSMWVWILVLIVVVAAVWFFGLNKSAPVGGDRTQIDLLEESAYTRGIVLAVDGEDYYFDGPADAGNGGKDIPGHAWVDLEDGTLAGLHYNTGPNGAPRWWSSDAPDGALLYKVDAIVDTWTERKAERYADDGFVHYHELARVSDGQFHPTKVVWLRHTAEISFTLDGGPGAPNPPYAHAVTPGVDLLFPPNGMTPYPESEA